jgi:hypothetical protein
MEPSSSSLPTVIFHSDVEKPTTFDNVQNLNITDILNTITDSRTTLILFDKTLKGKSTELENADERRDEAFARFESDDVTSMRMPTIAERAKISRERALKARREQGLTSGQLAIIAEGKQNEENENIKKLESQQAQMKKSLVSRMMTRATSALGVNQQSQNLITKQYHLQEV